MKKNARRPWELMIGSAAVLVLAALIVNVRLQGIAMPEMDERALGSPVQVGDMALESKSSGFRSTLPVLSRNMPDFADIAAWLNGGPLERADLRGKVVLVDFWTYSCINCIRTLPYITAWDAKYRDQGLVIVGVHTPEFAFEKKEANVRDALKRHGITYAVALDNDYATWDNYANRYWPAKYLFDAEGRLRYRHFGEGEYEITERNIQELLAEADKGSGQALTTLPQTVDFSRIGSPETYLGYGRMELLGSPEEVLADRVQQYAADAEPLLNRFYFEGRWIVGAEFASLARAPGGLAYRYRASNVHLVMGAEAAALAEVTLDGAPVPESLRGEDVFERQGKTYVRVNAERMYNLVNGKGVYAERVLRIRFMDPGVRVYAFTFG